MSNPPMIKQITLILLSFFLLSLFLTVASCRKKDQVDTSPGITLSFSSDTIFFDTVLVTVGSVTKYLTVHNTGKNRIRISSIRMGGGNSSMFTMNVDGVSAQQVYDLEVAGNDSLFIFIRLTVDPNNQQVPFIVTDSVLFTVNGATQKVPLVAWGRNADFYLNRTLEGIHTWDSLKARVIYGFCRIDTGSQLLILPGTRVYFHKNAFLAVSDEASLKAAGTAEQPIRFLGDRLDGYYRDLPGQWAGIHLEQGSTANEVSYCVIANAINGLVLGKAQTGGSPMLIVDNTWIYNVTGDGITTSGSSLVSANCVIGNCGGALLNLTGGGNYHFRHLTAGNYWSYSIRFGPGIYLNNFTYDSLGNKIPSPLEQAYFGNCIVYGSELEEIMFDSVSNAMYHHLFDHCLLRTARSIDNPQYYTGSFANEDPGFLDPLKHDFRIDSLSFVIGKGIPMGVGTDILGRSRGDQPALGAYEYYPEPTFLQRSSLFRYQPAIQRQ